METGLDFQKMMGGGYALIGDGFVLWLHQSRREPLVEYKFFCFNGKAKIVDICMGKAHTEERTNDYCDAETLQRLGFTSLLPHSSGKLNKPQNYDKMIELAEIIAKDISQLRVDFYNIDGKIYFGEATFFHNSGLEKFEPDEWDYKLGEKFTLPERQNDERK